MIKLEELLKLNRHDLKNKVIVFPTDTVYGIGALWDDFKGIDKIYELKKRDGKKPLAVLISNFDQIKDKVELINKKSLELINNYWPGAVTFIFKKKASFNYPLETIAFRIPDSKIAHSILEQFGPIATTSVNLSGDEPINNPEIIDKQFNGKIDYIVNDFATFSKISSTVVDLTTDEIRILRQGEIHIK